MYRDLCYVYVWSHEAYWGWYKCIGDDTSDGAVEIEAEVEVDIGGWGTQWPEGLIAPDNKLELNK